MFEINRCDMDEKAEIKIANIEDLIEKNGNHYFFHRKLVTEGKERFVKIMFQPLFDKDKQVSEIVQIEDYEEIKSRNGSSP